jgi:hypothetical protein
MFHNQPCEACLCVCLLVPLLLLSISALRASYKFTNVDSTSNRPTAPQLPQVPLREGDVIVLGGASETNIGFSTLLNDNNGNDSSGMSFPLPYTYCCLRRDIMRDGGAVSPPLKQLPSTDVKLGALALSCDVAPYMSALLAYVEVSG